LEIPSLTFVTNGGAENWHIEFVKVQTN